MLDFHKILATNTNPGTNGNNDKKKAIVDILIDSAIVAAMVGVGVYDPSLALAVQAGVVLKTFFVAFFGQLVYEKKIKKAE